MMRGLLVLGLVLPGILPVVSGSASILARPPRGARAGATEKGSKNGRAGFIVNENKPIMKQQKVKGDFVSPGIRSSCARKKASTLKAKHAASAAASLRGGSVHFAQPPVLLSSVHIPTDNVDPAKDSLNANSRMHSCGGASPSSFARSNGQVFEDTPPEDDSMSAFDDEEEDNRRIGGGGGGRVGGMPSFPRTLPSGKAPYSKKFAWVP